jgi:hypothetical protein
MCVCDCNAAGGAQHTAAAKVSAARFCEQQWSSRGHVCVPVTCALLQPPHGQHSGASGRARSFAAFVRGRTEVVAAAATFFSRHRCLFTHLRAGLLLPQDFASNQVVSLRRFNACNLRQHRALFLNQTLLFALKSCAFCVEVLQVFV